MVKCVYAFLASSTSYFMGAIITCAAQARIWAAWGLMKSEVLVFSSMIEVSHLWSKEKKSKKKSRFDLKTFQVYLRLRFCMYNTIDINSQKQQTQPLPPGIVFTLVLNILYIQNKKEATKRERYYEKFMRLCVILCTTVRSGSSAFTAETQLNQCDVSQMKTTNISSKYPRRSFISE